MAHSNNLLFIKNTLLRKWKARKGRHFLSEASLLLDARCFSRCHSCPHSLLRTQPNFKQLISLEEAVFVAEQLAKNNCARCTFYCCEPVLRPDLADIVAQFRNRGITATLVTNGYYSDPRWLRDLKKAGLTEIHLEVFGSTAATHDRTLVMPGAFEQIFQLFHAARELRIHCTMDVMPTHETIANGEFKKIVRLAEGQNIQVHVHYPALVGGYTGEYNFLLTKDELAYVRQFFQLSHVKSDFTQDGKLYHCPAGWKSIHILSDGHVCPCQFIHISFGNILTESLRDILFRMWSTKIFSGQVSRCLVGESLMFNRIYLQPVFNADALPLYYKNHLMFIEGEPLIRFYVNSSGRIIEKSEDVTMEKVKTLRVL